MKINIFMNSKYWKYIAVQEIIALRALFILNMVWDFFMTVVMHAPQHGYVLLDTGAAFAPYITIIWILAIIGSIFILFDIAQVDKHFRSFFISSGAAIALTLAVVLYTMLVGIAVTSSIIIWPMVLGYGINLLWAIGLLYCQIRYSDLTW